MYVSFQTRNLYYQHKKNEDFFWKREKERNVGYGAAGHKDKR
jgi:hypothetical protein